MEYWNKEHFKRTLKEGADETTQDILGFFKKIRKV